MLYVLAYRLAFGNNFRLFCLPPILIGLMVYATSNISAAHVASNNSIAMSLTKKVEDHCDISDTAWLARLASEAFGLKVKEVLFDNRLDILNRRYAASSSSGDIAQITYKAEAVAQHEHAKNSAQLNYIFHFPEGNSRELVDFLKRQYGKGDVIVASPPMPTFRICKNTDIVIDLSFFANGATLQELTFIQNHFSLASPKTTTTIMP
jgi:hypothetical protein